MPNRSFHFLRESDHLIVGFSASNPAEERHLFAGVDQVRQTRQVFFAGTDAGPLSDQRTGRTLSREISTAYVAGQHNHANSAVSNCALHRDMQNALELLRVRYQLAVVATLLEQIFRVGLLKISRADFAGGNVRGDGKHWSVASMGI